MKFAAKGVWPGLIACVALFCAGPVSAQGLSISLGGDGSVSAQTVQLIALITVLSLAPGIAIMITCFPFMVTVLSILRQGIGLQQSPPNMLIVSLALFLTYFVMEPVFSQAWAQGLSPLLEDRISVDEGMRLALGPFRDFMSGRVDAETDLPPEAPSFITRVCGSGFHSIRFRFGQARRARSPQIAQASGALLRVSGCRAMSAA